MTDRYFECITHATTYSQVRQPPPVAITEKILKFIEEKLLPPHELALDIGCGTGQSTQIWCRHFRKVIGCDVSEAQINVAQKVNQNSGVSYLVCPSHSIPLPDHTVDLVSTVASLHWFDIDGFFQETRRLLKPKGVLAVQGYHQPVLLFDTETKNKIARELIKKLIGEDLVNYWSPRITINKNKFSDVSFPFNQVVRYTDIRSEVKATISDVIGFITSYSSYQDMKRKEPDKLDCIMKNFRTRLLELAGDDENTFSFARDHFLILCRDD